jgi:hypothetical protein
VRRAGRAIAIALPKGVQASLGQAKVHSLSATRPSRTARPTRTAAKVPSAILMMTDAPRPLRLAAQPNHCQYLHLNSKLIYVIERARV